MSAGLACAAGCGSGALKDRDASGVGGAGPAFEPCVADVDPRLVIAPRRTFVLTSPELVTMIRVLVDDTEARAIVDAGVFAVTTDIQRRFPPWANEIRQIADADAMKPFTNVARHAAGYLFDNFARVTGCAPAADGCAQAYLGAFAEKAYRRPLDAQEQSELDARYQASRSSETIEEATRDAVAAILAAPQFLYRSEMGDASRPSLSPPGLPLTPHELASALSFFLTDGPPDQALLDDARAGTLSATLPAHVDRLLATPAAHAWLTTVVETLFLLNQLPGTLIDTGKFPVVNAKLLADMQTEARLFLGDVLWNANLADLLLSTTTYLNTNLATTVYQVPVPAGATETAFVKATLPADQRSGILTNAGVLTTQSRADGIDMVTRGVGVNAWLVGRDLWPPPDTLREAIEAAARLSSSQTAQQQAAYRASRTDCASCHVHFDPYGVALDNYDIIGRFRTVDDLGKPVDAHAKLGPELGGVTVANAVDLARVMAGSPVLANGMARHMLIYAVGNYRSELPDPSADVAGCAVADAVRRYEAGGAKTFSALMRAIALSPAFSLRLPAP